MYDFGIRQAHTGYRIAYRHGETNHCPGCGQTQWHIGRMTAECAFCATALPLMTGANMGNALSRTRSVSALAA